MQLVNVGFESVRDWTVEVARDPRVLKGDLCFVPSALRDAAQALDQVFRQVRDERWVLPLLGADVCHLCLEGFGGICQSEERMMAGEQVVESDPTGVDVDLLPIGAGGDLLWGHEEGRAHVRVQVVPLR